MPDNVVREPVDVHVEPTIVEHVDVGDETSPEFEEGAVATGAQLVAMVATERDHLVFVLPALAVLADSPENLGVGALLGHLVDGSLRRRSRSALRLVTGIDVPDYEARVREDSRAVRGGDGKRLRFENTAKPRAGFVHDALEHRGDLGGVAGTFLHHLQDGGEKVQNPLVDISAAHGRSPFQRTSSATNGYIPDSAGPAQSRRLATFLYYTPFRSKSQEQKQPYFIGPFWSECEVQ